MNLLKKRRYQEHREIHKDIIGDENMEIEEPKPKKTTKSERNKLKDNIRRHGQENQRNLSIQVN